jgi:hypothetical protein
VPSDQRGCSFACRYYREKGSPRNVLQFVLCQVVLIQATTLLLRSHQAMAKLSGYGGHSSRGLFWQQSQDREGCRSWNWGERLWRYRDQQTLWRRSKTRSRGFVDARPKVLLLAPAKFLFRPSLEEANQSHRFGSITRINRAVRKWLSTWQASMAANFSTAA